MSLPSRFVKMAGGGNDFLVFEADGRALTEEDRTRLALVCRRGLSVGADGALFLSIAGDGRVRVDYFNADGGPATFCANGTRCAARYAVRRRLVSGGRAGAGDRLGAIASRVDGESVTLSLPPVAAPQDPIPISGRGLPPTAIPMTVGVPHLVVFVRGDLDTLRDRPVRPAAAPPSGHGRGRQRQLRPGVGRQSARGAHLRARRRRGDPVLRVRSGRRGDRGGRQGLAASPVVCGTRSGVDLTVEFRDDGDSISGVAPDRRRARGLRGRAPRGGLEAVTRAIPFGSPDAPPLPSKIVAVGKNYREHAAEFGSVAPEDEPMLFLKAPSSLVFGEGEIVLPPESAARGLRGRARSGRRQEDQELAAGALARRARRRLLRQRRHGAGPPEEGQAVRPLEVVRHVLPRGARDRGGARPLRPRDRDARERVGPAVGADSRAWSSRRRFSWPTSPG